MPERRRRGASIALASALALPLFLTACAAESDADAAASADQRVFADAEEGAYPVAIPHAYGETEIDEQPERVVVIGWAGADIVVDLGTIPVAQGVAAGAVEGDYYPWFEEAADALGGPLPEVNASLERGEVDLEYVLSQDPDLILAVNSGITEEEYARLTEIAPTVAYPEDPWSVSVDDHVDIIGEALGRPDAAEQIKDDLATALSDAAAEHPTLSGVSFVHAFTPGDDGQVVVFGSTDPRVQTLEALGLVPADGLGELEEGAGGGSSYLVSLEQLIPLRPDLFVGSGTDDEWSAALEAHPAFASWEPVSQGRVARIADPELSLAYATATPLGLRWGVDDIADILSDAVG
ncbi:ABC transporter substrate-binding protein [Microbacterium marinilacus]|uniref:Iron-siderophore ABC transporter substrate-binding protein n=1 Tax=Microbacterium marinilacus TaxID=415209 RepID=A0ABP7BEJ1_9MICO|nr:ABC transporter substrate-binding protein [Microbacterium marinilacus]MBY0689314.1 ABC transporter substrate-binding protein [Microbacterium marinilacus]